MLFLAIYFSSGGLLAEHQGLTLKHKIGWSESFGNGNSPQ